VSFSGKIRLFLIIAALLPPAIIMVVVYIYSEKDTEKDQFARIMEGYNRYEAFSMIENAGLIKQARILAESKAVLKSIGGIRTAQTNAETPLPDLDFAEIIDRDGTILFSFTRPGLIGETQESSRYEITARDSIRTGFTVEYDYGGRHAALTALITLESGYLFHTGRFLDNMYLAEVNIITGLKSAIIFENDSAFGQFRDYIDGQIYRQDDTAFIVLDNPSNGPFIIIGATQLSDSSPATSNMLLTAGTVGLLGVLCAVLFGIFITGQAKKEIDNLIEASNRISAGDYKTPVMAYNEGEFSRLADAFTDMMLSIRKTQDKLAMSEKIAAWKAIGQKVAHEIKNPLTPIEISVDDLRRSRREHLPDFDKILDSTTSIIKTETARLKKLLDNFVAFARMEPPQTKPTHPKDIISKIEQLHRSEIASGKIRIDNYFPDRTVMLDPDKIEQVLINLIKNARETGPDTAVKVHLREKGNSLEIEVSDNGPGFPEKIINEGIRPYVSTKKEGSGLGLVICQRVIYDHNGTMEIANNENGGGSVVLTFPV